MANHIAYMAIPKSDLDANLALYTGSHQTAESARKTLHGTVKSIISLLTTDLVYSSVSSKYTAYAKLSEAEARLEVAKDEWNYYSVAVADVDGVGKQLFLTGDVSASIKAGNKIKVIGSTRHNGEYTVSLNSSFNATLNQTIVNVSEVVATKVAGDVFGNLLYQINR